MEQVKKEALTGYRQPTTREVELIGRYMKREMSRVRRIVGFWQAFCTVIAATMLLRLVPPIGFDQSTGDKIMALIFGVPLVLGIFAMNKSRRQKKYLIQQICSGVFSVMDCWIYDTQFGTELKGLAWVKVYNSQGQHCTDRMLIDYWAAENYRRGKREKLVLMRCENTFELFSELRMEENRG